MTIKDFVLQQEKQGINGWLDLCKKHGFNKSTQDLIIQAADFFNKIEINHNADFVKSINL